MGIVQHQQDRALAESVGLIHVPLHLSAADIVGPMSTSYVTAVTQKGAGKIIVPEGPSVVIYTAGTVPFGGNPNLQIGYPGLPVAFVNSSAGISDTDSEGHIFQCGSIGSSLFDFINQPFVLSFADASAAYGTIVSFVVASGGSGYQVGDEPSFSAGNGPTIHVDAVNGGGVILTAHAIDALTMPGGNAMPVGGGSGTGATFNVTVTQGNGSIDLSFYYRVLSLY